MSSKQNYIYSDLIPAMMAQSTLDSLVQSIDRSLVLSFVRRFVGSFVRWFVRSSFVRSFVRSIVHFFARSFVRTFVYPLFHSFIHSFRYLLVCWLVVFQCYCHVLINFHSTDVRVGFCFDKFDEDGCTNPKGREMRKSVCCCTMGAGWGDPCELCPQKNTCK